VSRVDPAGFEPATFAV